MPPMKSHFPKRLQKKAKRGFRGYPVGEVGIQTFPRVLGNGASTSMKNILATIKDMIIIHRKIFSKDYDLPSNGEHMKKD